MSRTVSPASGKPYGLDRVCRVWRASRATIYRHLSSSRPEPPRRPGPVGPMPDLALVEAIRAVVTASHFHGEGHRARVRDEPHPEHDGGWIRQRRNPASAAHLAAGRRGTKRWRWW